jgi:hypothetical protein
MFYPRLAVGMPEETGSPLGRTKALPSAPAIDAIGLFNKAACVRSLRSAPCL